jgi:hypothetical protein
MMTSTEPFLRLERLWANSSRSILRLDRLWLVNPGKRSPRDKYNALISRFGARLRGQWCAMRMTPARIDAQGVTFHPSGVY